VPNYDFNWQSTYVLAEPRSFPPQTKLRCIAWFDNSENNLSNPDPSIPVRWGDQTTEEMALGYFAVALPINDDESEEEGEEQTQAAANDGLSPELAAEAEAKARRLLKELDADGDGKVLRSEVTEQFARFAFRRYDRDGDGVLTLEELTEAVKESLRRKQRRRRD
jgi:hypothetical protein